MTDTISCGRKTPTILSGKSVDEYVDRGDKYRGEKTMTRLSKKEKLRENKRLRTECKKCRNCVRLYSKRVQCSEYGKRLPKGLECARFKKRRKNARKQPTPKRTSRKKIIARPIIAHGRRVMCRICHRPVSTVDNPIELHAERTLSGWRRRFIHARCDWVSFGDVRRARATKTTRQLMGIISPIKTPS